jgi:hypothetical protein
VEVGGRQIGGLFFIVREPMALQAEVSGTEKTLSPPLCRVGHAWMTETEYAVLLDNARRRRVHPDRLLAQIAVAVMINGYTDAVLEL